jgi:hypothetical protein
MVTGLLERAGRTGAIALEQKLRSSGTAVDQAVRLVLEVHLQNVGALERHENLLGHYASRVPDPKLRVSKGELHVEAPVRPCEAQRLSGVNAGNERSRNRDAFSCHAKA